MATEPTPVPAAPRRRRSPLVLALAGAGLVAAVVLAVVLLTGGGDRKGASSTAAATGADAKQATLEYPSTWAPLDRAALAKAGNRAVVAIRRKDRSGLIVVRAEPAPKAGYAALGADLRKQLAARFGDFRPVSTRMIRTRAGDAFYFSFVRAKTGTAQSITLVKVGDRMFSVNSVLRADATKAAQETGSIIRSFGPAS